VRYPANSTNEFFEGGSGVPINLCDFECRPGFDFRITLTSEVLQNPSVMTSVPLPRYIQSSAHISNNHISNTSSSPLGSAYVQVGGGEDISANVTVYEPSPIFGLYKSSLCVYEDECGKIVIKGDMECGNILFHLQGCCGNEVLEKTLRFTYCASRNAQGVQLQLTAKGAPARYRKGISNGVHRVHTKIPGWHSSAISNALYGGEAGFVAQVPFSQGQYTGRECDMDTEVLLEFRHQEH
jgi:hypothetical protein